MNYDLPEQAMSVKSLNTELDWWRLHWVGLELFWILFRVMSCKSVEEQKKYPLKVSIASFSSVSTEFLD